MEKLNISVTDPKVVGGLQNSGKPVVFTIVDDKLVGAFA